MLNVHNLSVSFQGEYLFEDVAFMLNAGDRVGLIGKNGAGKSTMLKLLSRELKRSTHANSSFITVPASHSGGAANHSRAQYHSGSKTTRPARASRRNRPISVARMNALQGKGRAGFRPWAPKAVWRDWPAFRAAPRSASTAARR